MKKKTVTSETEEITIDNKKQKRKREKKAYREIRWDRLDNTAHLFPVIAGENMSNVYRISVTLTELVQPDILQQALNIVLPKMDGFEVCQHIREFSNMPIVMLTAKGDDMDKILGLEYGADDYITKPFKLGVLVSRINALLRRAKGFNSTDTELQSNGIKVLMLQGQVFKNEKLIDLTAAEYKLLCLFMKNPNVVLTKEQILDKLWDCEGNYIDSSTLTVYMRRLRMKIEDNPSEPQMLLTVRRMGYKWNVLG